jgi:arginase
VDQGPEALVEAGLLAQLHSLGWHVNFNAEGVEQVRAIALDDNDTDADIGKIKRPRAVSAVNERVSEDVARIIQKGHLPLTLGGDHSLVSGVEAGVEGRGEGRGERDGRRDGWAMGGDGWR